MKNPKKVEYPSVTVVMITYNDEKIIEKCFQSIKKQEYLGKVNILIVDGGSFDGSLRIAKKYKVLIISKPQYRDMPYKRVEIAMSSVKTDIALLFSADNRFKETDCLSKMVEPFSDKEISAVETFRFGYRNIDSILTKYFALIGGTDPIAISLDKADRAPYDILKWHSYGKVEEKSQYFKVTFSNDESKIPTLGANGFAVRNNIIKKFPFKDGLHIETCVNLIKKGYDKFAFVKDVHIIHDIEISLIEFLKRKLRWKQMYSNTNIKRAYLIYNPKRDKLKLFLIIFTNITLIVPLLRAIKGFIKKRELAWFLHPIMCNIFTISYGVSVFERVFQRKNKDS
ncbi:MAG: glycosyltransferase [bacterium]|nr:glycosyltransferase [bacterium]